MNYKFETQKLDIDKYPYLFIKINDVYRIITRFSDSGWTPQKVQEIVDGIESSKNKPIKQEYIWANEDLTLYSNKNGVLLVDMIAQRFGKDNPEEITLHLQHDEMITFLKDFKKFVAENT